MLKITFTSPQRIIQHGLEQECMFVVCDKIRLCGNALTLMFDDSLFVIPNTSFDVEIYKL